MSAKPRDFGMTPLDDLFSTDESRAESQLEKVVTLNPAEISDFPNHPFKVKQDEAMAEMVESVRKYGVLVPALVRPKADGGYEMVAGHRRKFAATLAELPEIPCIVRDLTDDEATIIMVDSNLQRETILPSEKAFAYKMKLDAMKRQVGRPSKENSVPVGQNFDGKTSRELLAAKSPDSNTQIQRYLYITVSHKTAEEMADQYNFNADQRKQLAELLADENQRLWCAVLYGIGTGDGEIVTVALSQIGNVGGAPYWSWYGFNSRVEWCACFVSWCANECGYIDAGVIPKFAGCVWGVEWFRDRGLWQDNSYEPRPGDIIFFDWDNKGSSGPQDGESDHVGIVEKVENGTVYTVEGNSGDSCRENHYAIGYYEILGYGMPQY